MESKFIFSESQYPKYGITSLVEFYGDLNETCVKLP